MSRITTVLTALAEQQRKALIPYLTAGDPDLRQTLALLNTLVASGADIIELGVPFSDPMADGPVIQRACERALAQQVSLEQILQLVAEFRQHNQNTPLVLMGYLNPIEQMGVQKFVAQAVAAGVDGVLVVDLPPEEAHELHTALRAHNLDLIFLIAPTTSNSRIEQIAALASGYLYYVSLRGVTGAQQVNPAEIAERIGQIRQKSTLPIAVGFGIKDAATAASMAALADGIIIGSALVQVIEQASGAEYPSEQTTLLKDIANFLNTIKSALG